MKKIVGMAAITLGLISTLSAVEQCDEWFKKNDFGIVGTMGKDGVGVTLNKQGEMDKIFAAGVAFYDFGDPEEVSDGLKEAAMVAKANMTKYLNEKISTDEEINKISSKKKELTKSNDNTNNSVIKKTVKTQTLAIKNSASHLLTGVIKVCESNDAAKKEVQVVLAVSPRTAKSASQVSNAINKEIGSRKTAEEYAQERKMREAQGDSTPAAASASSAGGNTQKQAPTNSSFSNKAKNMNF